MPGKSQLVLLFFLARYLLLFYTTALQASSNAEVSPGACKLLGAAWSLFQVAMKKNLIRERLLLFFFFFFFLPPTLSAFEGHGESSGCWQSYRKLQPWGEGGMRSGCTGDCRWLGKGLGPRHPFKITLSVLTFWGRGPGTASRAAQCLCVALPGHILAHLSVLTWSLSLEILPE